MTAADSPLIRLKQMKNTDEYLIPPVLRTKRIKVSRMSVQELVKEADSSTASGSFNTGQSLLVSVSLNPENLHPGAKPIGVPQISIYQGTEVDDDNQIYPRSGSNITPGDYIFDSGFDWGAAASDGSDLVFNVAIENIDAGSVSIYVVASWRYVANEDSNPTGGF